MNILERIKNLWKLSGISLEKTPQKPISEVLKKFTSKKAIIVEDDPLDKII